MKPHTARPALLAIATAALLAGCGSTVHLGASSAASQSLGGDGLGLGLGAAPSQSATTGTDQLTSQPGGVLASDGSQSSASGQAPSGSPTDAGVPTGSAGGPAGSGFGYTKSTITVGYGASDGNSSAITALGVSGVDDPGNGQAQIAAVVNDINKHGGVAGRRLVAIPHVYNTSQSLNDPNTASQTACADMTQDHKVYAMLSPAINNEVALSCFGKAGVPILYGGGIEYVNTFASSYQRYPLYFNVGGMKADRFFAGAVQRLYERNFFQKWNTSAGAPGSEPVKVGFYVVDNPAGNAQIAIYTAALKKIGITPALIIKLPDNLSASIAAQSSAVLRFHSAGITHVLASTVPFQAAAEQQGYRPRYFSPFSLVVLAATSSARQLSGSMAEGYLPAEDTLAQKDPGLPTAATAHCVSVMKAGGQNPTNRTMLWTEEGLCDVLYTFKAAADATNGDLSNRGFVRAMESLGKVNLAVTWDSVFGPSEHASTRAFRDMIYDSQCKCFAYVDKINRVVN